MNTYFFLPESKKIRSRYELVVAIDNFLWHLGSGEMTAYSLARHVEGKPPEVESVLSQYVQAGVLSHQNGKRCPNSDCGIGVIWENEYQNEECPSCHTELTDDWRALPSETHYIIIRRGRTFPPWMILIHGMNSPGKWQERIVFLHGLLSETSPFRIYKYGIKRIEPFFNLLQNCRAKEFLRDYNEATEEARSHGINEPPDVIAHSFGTLIIGKALRADTKIAFGKILLCGSILPPDFEWAKYIDEKRVAIVLNHFGGRDFWAKIAVRAIPNSGPSGRIGFIETRFHRNRVYNVLYPDYSHCDFFEGSNYEKHFNELWRPFLWGKLDELGQTINLHQGINHWDKPLFCFRAPYLTWLILILVIILLWISYEPWF